MSCSTVPTPRLSRAVAAACPYTTNAVADGHQSDVSQLARPLQHKHSYSSSRASLAGAGLLGAACLAAMAASHSQQSSCRLETPQRRAGTRDGFPVISKAEVAKHKSREAGGIWVTYAGGVYDITDFIASHPGGTSRISMAAGGALEPFWNLYALHMKDEVCQFLYRLAGPFMRCVRGGRR